MAKPMLMMAVVATLATAADGVLAQTMYQYRDASGNMTFSDRPPPRGVPLTTHGSAAPAPQPSANPNAPPPPGAVPDPTAPVQAPRALPGEALGNVPPGVVAPPGSVGDRRAFIPDQERRQEQQGVRAFTPQGEAQIERDSLRANVPVGERQIEQRDVRIGVPAGEAAAERSAERQFVPQGEAARDARDRSFGMPSDEAAREREAVRLNQ